jgi:hypothetical protein
MTTAIEVNGPKNIFFLTKCDDFRTLVHTQRSQTMNIKTAWQSFKNVHFLTYVSSVSLQRFLFREM